MKGVKELLEEEDSAERTGYAEDIAKLRAEEKEELATGSTLLPAQTKEDIARRDAKEAEKRERENERRDKTPSHPPTYVVQEGDTLYRIAVRFYGRLSAWKMIRDANKTVISNDGRVRAGVTIVLPGP
jgi:nucleoid-associated protein YgaU